MPTRHSHINRHLTNDEFYNYSKAVEELRQTVGTQSAIKNKIIQVETDLNKLDRDYDDMLLRCFRLEDESVKENTIQVASFLLKAHRKNLEAKLKKWRRLLLPDPNKPTPKGHLSTDELAKIKSIPIEDLHPFEKLSTTYQCVGGGGRLKACCPFEGHDDDTPSLTIYTQNNSFYCFGCQKGGDAITFIQILYGYDFLEACEYLRNHTR